MSIELSIAIAVILAVISLIISVPIYLKLRHIISLQDQTIKSQDLVITDMDDRFKEMDKLVGRLQGENQSLRTKIRRQKLIQMHNAKSAKK